jgi:hypothetical protein
MAAIFFFVSGLINGLSFNARETVVCETPATLAISLIVTIENLLPFCLIQA